MRSTLRAALAVASGVCVLAVVPAVSGVAVAEDAIVSSPVSFDVVTSNNTGVPCLNTPGERQVTVRGNLTGPRSAVQGDTVDGAVYSHGNGYGEFFWRWTDDPELNVVDDLARRGHVSVSIDRIGYEASDAPNGNEICFGTEADVLHQIITQLRAGEYGGAATPTFARVALLGHSASGFIVDQEAYAFGDVDALGVLSSGSPNGGPLVAQRAAEFQGRCLTAADGYAALEGSDADFQADHVHNTEPDIAAAITARRNPDACAGIRNAGSAVAADVARNAEIDVPVLVLVGANDAFFPGDPQAQADLYTGSPEVTLRTLPDTGHALAFGRTAPLFRDELHSWLTANDF